MGATLEPRARNQEGRMDVVAVATVGPFKVDRYRLSLGNSRQSGPSGRVFLELVL